MTRIANFLRRFFHENVCNCPASCAYCANTGRCTCPPDEIPRTDLDTMAARFERFCDENPGHHDCRIYD